MQKHSYPPLAARHHTLEMHLADSAASAAIGSDPFAGGGKKEVNNIIWCVIRGDLSVSARISADPKKFHNRQGWGWGQLLPW